MTTTSTTLDRRRQAVIRVVGLQFDLYRTLRTGAAQGSDPRPNPERTWAEMLCLLPALNACLQRLNAALLDAESLPAAVDDMERLGAELCRLHLGAIRSGNEGDHLAATSRRALETLLASLTEWTSAVAQLTTGETASIYEVRQTPAEHRVEDTPPDGRYRRSKTRACDELRSGLLAFGVRFGVSAG